MLLKSRLPKFAAVSPSSAAAFYRDLWTPPLAERQSMIRLFDQDRPAFEARLADARRRGDHAGSLAALEVLGAVDGLSPETAEHLWSELLRVQRWDDALRLLEDRRFTNKASASFWYDLACARAAARSLASARQALERALAQDPGHAASQELAALLERAAVHEDGARTVGGCEQLADLVDLLVDLHRFREAAAHLRSFLVRAQGSLPLETQELMVIRARTLFRVLDPASALVLLLGLRSVFTARGLDEVFEWACAALASPENPHNRAPADFGEHLGLQVCLAQAFAAQGRWRTAVVLLGPVAGLPADPFDIRLDLARCVSRAVASDVKPVFTASSDRPKIVDVFPFFDELMLLKLKLEEMSPWVDRFVLIEARTTFTGAPKALVYEQNKAAFAPYADKIVHLVVDYPGWVDSPWAREFYQRDMALATIASCCGPEDLIIFSDADEIVDRAAVQGFEGEYASLSMQVFCYFLNLRRTYKGQGICGGVCRAKYFDRIGLAEARMGLRRYGRREKLPDAGWHFSSIKDANGLLAKFRSSSHTDVDRFQLGELTQRLDDIRAQRGFPGFECCEIDDRMPRALRDNLDLISEHILPAGPEAGLRP